MEKVMSDKEFAVRLTNTVREQMLEYVLWKVVQYPTYEEFREGIKKELCHIHEKNMNHVDVAINGNSKVKVKK